MRINDDGSITANYVRGRFHYNPYTGELIWRPKEEKTRFDRAWNKRYAGKPAGTRHSAGYWHVAIKGRKTLLHRIVWLYHYGEWPNGIMDHIDRNPSNNRISNLRICTHSENVFNTSGRSDNTSGVKGLYWHKASGKWHLCIHKDGRKISLGYFESIEVAREARVAAEQQYWGAEACC